LLVALSSVACSSGLFTGDTSHKTSTDDGSGDDTSGGSEIEGDDENESISPPVQVTGSYLTCGEAPEYEPTDPTSVPRGCALTKDGQKTASTVEGAAVDTNSDAGHVPAFTEPAPQASAWHFYFALPAEAKDGLRDLEIEATIDAKRVRIIKMTGTAIGSWRIVASDAPSDDKTRSGDDAILSVLADEPPRPIAAGRILFVTSKDYAVGSDEAGSFSSQAAANARCLEVAQLGLPELKTRNWNAMISETPSPLNELYNPLDVADVVNVKNQKLFDVAQPRRLVTPVAFDEAGRLVPEGTRVWTGSTHAGGVNPNCGDWKVTGGERAEVGDPRSRVSWLSHGSEACTSRFHLYCLSLP
jgi:hypothetical protein